MSCPSHVERRQMIFVHRSRTYGYLVHTSGLLPVSNCGKERYENSRESIIWEFFLQCLHHALPDARLLIKRLELISLLHTRIAAYGAYIHHPVPKLHKRAPLNGDIVTVGDPAQTEVD